MLLSIIAFSVLIVLLKLVAAASQNPVVCSESGCVRGKLMPGYQTKAFEAFLGIPFAKPPVGELRFQVNFYIFVDINKKCKSNI
jgi:hypothetical protein